MIISNNVITAAKAMGDDNMAGQFVDRGGSRIRAAGVVDMLADRTSPGAQRGARRLLQGMGTARWTVVAGIHRNAHDPTPHITVEVLRRRYHLRLDARQCISDIVMTVNDQHLRVGGNLPWVGPGA